MGLMPNDGSWLRHNLKQPTARQRQRTRTHGAHDMISPLNLKPTSRNSEISLARMTACETEASTAALPNVRDRALRAAAAWQEMYDKARLFEKRHDRLFCPSRMLAGPGSSGRFAVLGGLWKAP